MSHERNFERVLRSWVDEGADLAPERFVWTALEAAETTPQREAWQASLEGLIMKLKPAAPILGVAAVAILAIVTYQLFAKPVGQEPTPMPSASPTASPVRLTVADLEMVVIGGSTLPAGWELAETIVGRSSLVTYPTRSETGASTALAEIESFEAGLAREFSGPDGVYANWVVVFKTEADAQRAAAVYLADFVDPASWGLELTGTSGIDGPEGAKFTGSTVRFFAGPPGSEPIPVEIRIWRVGRILVALAATIESGADPGLHMLGDNMVNRARDLIQ